MKMKHVILTALVWAGFISTTTATTTTTVTRSRTATIPVAVDIPNLIILYYVPDVVLDYDLTSGDSPEDASASMVGATIEVTLADFTSLPSLDAGVTVIGDNPNSLAPATVGLGKLKTNGGNVTYTVTNAWAYRMLSDANAPTTKLAVVFNTNGENKDKLYHNSAISDYGYITISAPKVKSGGSAYSPTLNGIATVSLDSIVGNLQFSANFTNVAKAGDFSFLAGEGIKITVTQE